MQKEKETLEERLAHRQRQIDIGKNTPEYQYYRKKVPKSKRRRGIDPETPRANDKRSNRSFKGVVNEWRRKIYEWTDRREDHSEPPYFYPLQCAVCGSRQGLSKCGNCNIAVYCGRECQLADYNHKCLMSLK
jgi:hypothetical protein